MEILLQEIPYKKFNTGKLYLSPKNIRYELDADSETVFVYGKFPNDL